MLCVCYSFIPIDYGEFADYHTGLALMFLPLVLYVDFVPNLVFLNIVGFMMLFIGYPLTYGYELTKDKVIAKIMNIIAINSSMICCGMSVTFVTRLNRQVELQMMEYFNLLNRLKEGLIVKNNTKKNNKILFANQAAIDIMKY